MIQPRDRPHRVVQEEDRVARRAWLWTGGAVLGTVLLCLAAWLVLRAFTGTPLRPPAEVPAGVGAPPGAGAERAPGMAGQPFGRGGPAAARDTVDTTGTGSAAGYGWVDRQAGIATVPVEVAMELMILLEGGDTSGAGRAGRPEAPPAAEAGETVRPRREREPGAGPPALAEWAEPVLTRDTGGGTSGGPTDLARATRPEARRDVGTARPHRGPRDPAPAGPDPADTTRRHPVLSAIDVEPRVGARLPLDVVFTDTEGRSAPLGSAFTGERPVLLVPGWYRCRMLCGLVADGLADALGSVDALEAGRDYEVVLVSIDPREGPADASERRERVRARLGVERLRGWRFLTGPGGAAAHMADSLGFGYRYDPSTDQYAHAAAVFAVSPTGALTGVLYGVRPDPADLERAISLAAAEKQGFSLEKVLVRCFRYTPALQRYAGLIANVLRGGGALIVLGLAGVFLVAARRAAREAP